MWRKGILLLLVAAGVLSCLSASAQNAKAEWSLSKDTILIGEQMQIKMQLSVAMADDIIFPEIKDTVVTGVEVLSIGDIEHDTSTLELELYARSMLVTSFDTGWYEIPSQPFFWIVANDTFTVESTPVYFRVEPFVNIDTIPRDTIYTKNTGLVVFGKNNFTKEIEQAIPDSIKQSLSEDELKFMQDSVFQQHAQRFSSYLFNYSGLKDQDEVAIIIGSVEKQLFITASKGILQQMRVPGAIDTLFVNEFDSVINGDALYVALQICDIDDTLYNTPLTLKELWLRLFRFLSKNWWWLILSVAAIVVGLIYLLRKKGISLLKIKIKPKEPAHIIAFREIERIRIEKLWKTGKIKNYYTDITDVLRRYIGQRFDLYAMEMTSDELLKVIDKKASLSIHDLSILRQILELSDLVKFARVEPLQHQHDDTLRNAKEFVENTLEQIINETVKMVDQEMEKESENEENLS